MPTSYYGQDPYAPTNFDPGTGYMTPGTMYPSTGGVNNDNPYGSIESMSGTPSTTIAPQAPITGGVNTDTVADPNQTMQSTGMAEGTPWRDPATGQCYVYTNGKLQKAQDGACGGTMPHPGGTVNPDPYGDGGGSGIGTGGSPTVTPSGGSWQPNAPPTYPGGTPNVDPYDIGSSPDYSGFDFEGVSPVNPQASPFDYGQVSDFADAAWNQSMRYLEPQFQTEDRRFEQMLINKGLDPNSEAGMEALRRKEVGQNDLLSKSAFDALGFGTDLQNQMFGQDATRSGFANDMMQALMGLGQRGHEFDTTAGLNANQQAFAQMLALEGLDYRDYMTLIDQMRYDDSLALSLLGMGTAPSYQTVRTGLADAPYADYSGAWNMWDTPLFGGR